MNAPTILVVAPDEMFRLSLGFLMEAEGYRVRLADRLPVGEHDGERDPGCAVIDHSAMDRDPRRLESLRSRGVPIVLLASRLELMPQLAGVQLVEKPAQGATVVDAVHAALSSHRQSASGPTT